MMSGSELHWLCLHFPRDVAADEVRAFLRAILADRHIGIVAFDVQHQARKLRYSVAATSTSRLRQHLAAHVPTISVTRSAEPKAMNTRVQTYFLRLSSLDRPLKTDSPPAFTAALLGSLAISGTSTAGHRVEVGRRLSPQLVTEPNYRSPSPQTLVRALTVGLEPLHGPERRLLIDKQAQPGGATRVRLQVDDVAAPRVLPSYLAALRQLEAPGLQVAIRKPLLLPPRPMPLNAEELLTLIAWPVGNRSYPLIDRTQSATLPVTHRQNSERVLGRGTHPGHLDRQVTLSPADALRHLHVLGPTGVGKSTLLANLALQDIEAGRSTIVIDPKGDLVDDLLARIPSAEMRRVVLLDSSRTDHLVGFDPLAGFSQVTRQLAIDHVLHVFKTLFAGSWGPRSQDLLHASLLTITGDASETGSLIQLPKMLTDSDFRRRYVEKAPSQLTDFWRWFDHLTPGERAAVTGPLLNKLRPFTLRPSLRLTIGSPSPFDPVRIFTERRVLLVPLRRGELGAETAHLFGALLLAQLWQVVQQRSAIPQNRRHPAFIYADEFQAYTKLPTDLGDVLAQSRGLGVGLILAHQNLAQLDSSLRSVLLANAQNRVAFRLSAEDARVLVQSTPALDLSDFQALPRFQAYAQTLQAGNQVPWASIATKPLPRARRNPRAAAAQLARQHGLAVSEIEAHLDRLADQPEPSAEPEQEQPIGRRRRAK